MNFPYEDLVDLPRPVSKTRKPMSLRDRAAQFAPFAALTGYEENVEEAEQTAAARAEELGREIRRDR